MTGGRRRRTATPTPPRPPAPTWLDREDAADLLNVPGPTVALLARTYDWATTSTSGETLYALADVQHTADIRSRTS